jgi:hypothetical protein
MTKTKRKANTALVYNPARGLSLGSRTTRRASARKANPVKRTAVANPRKRRTTRRRRNPVSLFSNPSGSALMGAVFAGLGFSLLDLGLSRIVPSASPIIQIGTKVAAGFLVQTFGSKVPVLGKYKDGVAFLLFGLAAKQAADYWLLPTVRSFTGQITGGLQNVLMPAPASVTVAETMGGIVRRTRPNYY